MWVWDGQMEGVMKLNEALEAMELYWELGDGLAQNHDARLVTFESKASAQVFKRQFPNWRVQYHKQKGD